MRTGEIMGRYWTHILIGVVTAAGAVTNLLRGPQPAIVAAYGAHRTTGTGP
jgi:hypothetical protein